MANTNRVDATIHCVHCTNGHFYLSINCVEIQTVRRPGALLYVVFGGGYSASTFCFQTPCIHSLAYITLTAAAMYRRLRVASCLINAWPLRANEMGSDSVRSWHCRSFNEPDLFDNNVPFDNATPIYLINLLCELGLGLGLDLQLHCFRIFRGE